MFIPSATRSRCPDAKVVYGLMAAARSDGRAVSGRIFLLRSVFNSKTLPLPAMRLKSIRQRKQVTDGKSGCRQSVSEAVAVSQHPFDVGFTVEDFTAQLDIGYAPFVPVVLKCPAAHFQPCRHLLVGEETFTAQCRAVVGSQMLEAVKQTVKTAHEVDYPLAVLVNQFIHVTLDLVGIVSLLCSFHQVYIVLPLNFASLRLSSTTETIRFSLKTWGN